MGTQGAQLPDHRCRQRLALLRGQDRCGSGITIGQKQSKDRRQQGGSQTARQDKLLLASQEYQQVKKLGFAGFADDLAAGRLREGWQQRVVHPHTLKPHVISSHVVNPHFRPVGRRLTYSH